jgi:hypothetical protein
MRVLLLPANNAPEFQVKALEDIINKYDGHRIVRWSHGLSPRDYDIVICIAGSHNEDDIHTLWNDYSAGEKIIMDTLEFDRDGEIRIGKGIHAFVDECDKPMYLLMAPRQDTCGDTLEDFKDDDISKGPAFLLFDSGDVHINDEGDYKYHYGYINLLSVSDTEAYKYVDIITTNGGYCTLKPNADSQSCVGVCSPDVELSETSLSLLLLRR